MMMFKIGSQSYLYEHVSHGNVINIRLKQTLNSPGLNLPLTDWIKIHPLLSKFSTDTINEAHFPLDTNRWIILTALENVVLIQLRYSKGAKVVTRQAKLDKTDFVEVVANSLKIIEANTPKPSPYVPPATSPADSLTAWVSEFYGCAPT